jgi:hypothetical protein
VRRRQAAGAFAVLATDRSDGCHAPGQGRGRELDAGRGRQRGRAQAKAVGGPRALVGRAFGGAGRWGRGWQSIARDPAVGAEGGRESGHIVRFLGQAPQTGLRVRAQRGSASEPNGAPRPSPTGGSRGVDELSRPPEAPQDPTAPVSRPTAPGCQLGSTNSAGCLLTPARTAASWLGEPIRLS